MRRLQQPQLVNPLDDGEIPALVGRNTGLDLDPVARPQARHVPLALHQVLALGLVALLHLLVLLEHALEVRAPFLQAFVAQGGVGAQQGRERVGVLAAEGGLGEGGEDVAVDHQADFGGEGEDCRGLLLLGGVLFGGVAGEVGIRVGIDALVVGVVGRVGDVVGLLALFGGGVWVVALLDCLELLEQYVFAIFDGDAKVGRDVGFGEREAMFES